MFTVYKELRTKEERARKTKRNKKGKRLQAEQPASRTPKGQRNHSDPQIL